MTHASSGQSQNAPVFSAGMRHTLERIGVGRAKNIGFTGGGHRERA